MPGNERTLLTQAQMAAGVQALAQSILTANPGAESIALVGVFTRGVPLAKRIAAEIEKIGGVKVFLGTIDITQYRDDLQTMAVLPKLEGSEIAFDLDDAVVILCDEVMYTARTSRAALDELLDFGRPRCVQIAALVDRVGRELPLTAEYAGIRIDLPSNERVSVRFVDGDGYDEVFVKAWERKTA